MLEVGRRLTPGPEKETSFFSAVKVAVGPRPAASPQSLHAAPVMALHSRSPMTSDATPTADLPLPCPHCGYDLRGNVGGVCPECGRAFDPAKLVAAAPLPWNDRRQIGCGRAFARQAWQALRRPGELAGLVGRPVDYKSARRFQLLCVAVGGVALAVPLTAGFFRYRPALLASPALLWMASPPAASPPAVDLLLDGLVLLALIAGGFLWLLTAGGVAGYFLHPRDEPRRRQNSAVALFCFTAAPLALLPLATVSALVGEVARRFMSRNGSSLAGIVVAGGGFALAGLVAVVVAGLLWRGPTLLLRRGLGRGVGRVGAMTLTMLLAWPALFAACVLGLPALTWWAECVVLTLLA